MPVLLGRAGDDRLDDMASAARHLPLTYPEVGATAGPLPAGYRHGRFSIDLPPGGATFDRAVDGLRRWAAHRGAGARVFPHNAPIAAGQDVVVAVDLPLVTVVAPCRIVTVTDETDRFGFAYGSLAGHPVSGEESFHVVRRGGTTTFEVVVFSRPAHPLVRAMLPVALVAQRRTTKQYLAGLAAHCRSTRGEGSDPPGSAVRP